MEQFFKHLDFKDTEKQILHYQEFMLQIHEKEHKVNKKLKGKSRDTINVVANTFAQDLLVLCIDEF